MQFSAVTLEEILILHLEIKGINNFRKFQKLRSLAGVAQWIECRPVNQVSPVQFPVRAHAWFVGQDPVGGTRESTIH